MASSQLSSPIFYDHLIKEMPYGSLTENAHDAVKKSIQNCKACPLLTLTKPLPLNHSTAPIVVIGETPDDVLYNGKNGKRLADLLRKSDIHPSHVYTTSLVKCEESKDSSCCSQHLTAELLTLQASIIICLGYNVSLALMDAPQLGQYVNVMPNTSALVTYSFNDMTPEYEQSITSIMLEQFVYIKSVLKGMNRI